MVKIGIRLDDEVRGSFFDFMKEKIRTPRYSDTDYSDNFSFNHSVIYDYRNGKSNLMSFESFSEILSAVYESELRYDLSVVDKYVRDGGESIGALNDETMRRGRGFKRKLTAKEGEEDFLRYVLNHYDLEELTDRFGGKESLYRNWRKEKTRSVDADVLRTTASEMEEFLSEVPEIQPDIVDLGSYRHNGLEESMILENGDVGALEVLFYRRGREDPIETAKDLEEGSYPEGVELPDPWLQPQMPHLLNQLIRDLDDSGFIKSNQFERFDTNDAGFALSYLEETELIESWGSDTNGTFSIEADRPEIYDFWRQLAIKSHWSDSNSVDD